jgi:energy-coupling factor transporter ATP-binding protein EcfA2
VILVSHDMHLLSLVADRLWLVRAGAVLPWEGDLEDYRRMLLTADEAPKPAPKPEKPKKAGREEMLALRAEVRRCEERLGKLSEMRTKLSEKMADPGLYDEARKVELGRCRGEQARATGRCAFAGIGARRLASGAPPGGASADRRRPSPAGDAADHRHGSRRPGAAPGHPAAA